MEEIASHDIQFFHVVCNYWEILAAINVANLMMFATGKKIEEV